MSNIDILGYIVLISILFIVGYVFFLNYGDFQLKCIVSDMDGNKYCVRERSKLKQAANLLAKVSNKCRDLVDYVGNKYPDQENVKRLVKGFNPKRIVETLPTSKYTAYSENKGEKIAFCLNRNKHNNEDLIDESTLTFVAIHELSHVMSKSIGHKSEFWQNFKFLLENAKEAGIHNPVDYKNEPREYCGMKIHDNPYYDI
tara:strand:- start:3271 stop:3870 length:600 start_codon:yes stop_codon:yes gene_type:complete